MTTWVLKTKHYITCDHMPNVTIQNLKPFFVKVNVVWNYIQNVKYDQNLYHMNNKSKYI